MLELFGLFGQIMITYLLEPFLQIGTYLPELFWKIRSYLPEPFQQIRTYLPELLQYTSEYILITLKMDILTQKK